MATPPSPEKQGDRQQKPEEKPHPNAQTWQRDIKPQDWQEMTNRQLDRFRQSEPSSSKPSNGDPTKPSGSDASATSRSNAFASNENGQQESSRGARNNGDNRGAADATDRQLRRIAERSKDSNYGPAKADALKVIRERFRGDPQLPELERHLASMESRMLESENVAITDRSGKKIGEIDQRDQLRQRYENLALIGREAENLKDEDGHQVMSASDVNKVLSDAIVRGANPDQRFDQGENNTCADEKINGIATALMAGEELRSTAQMLTTGKFDAFDPATGTYFQASAHIPSMRLDREAKETSLVRGNTRGAYGQMADLRTGQLVQSLLGRAEARERGQSGGEDRYTYMKVPTSRRNDTGERVRVNIRPGENFETLRGGQRVNHNNNLLYDTDSRGRMVGPTMDPGLNGETTGVALQSLIGHYISPDFGKSMVIASQQSHGDLTNATTVSNSRELADHVRAVEAKGWRLPIVATHVSNYLRGPDGSLGGAQGWHAWSVKTDRNGNLAVAGSWGGEHEGAVSADRMFSYMNVSQNSRLPANHPDRVRGDHVFYPDRPDPANPDRALPRPENDELNKPGREKPNEKDLDKEKTAQEKEAEKEKERQERAREEEKDQERGKKTSEEIRYAQARLAEIEAAIAANDDPTKLTGLLAQQAALKNITGNGNIS